MLATDAARNFQIALGTLRRNILAQGNEKLVRRFIDLLQYPAQIGKILRRRADHKFVAETPDASTWCQHRPKQSNHFIRITCVQLDDLDLYLLGKSLGRARYRQQ